MSGDVTLGRALPATDDGEAAAKRRVLAKLADMPTAKVTELRDYFVKNLGEVPEEFAFGAHNLIACCQEELASRGAL